MKLTQKQGTKFEVLKLLQKNLQVSKSSLGLQNLLEEKHGGKDKIHTTRASKCSGKM